MRRPLYTPEPTPAELAAAEDYAEALSADALWGYDTLADYPPPDNAHYWACVDAVDARRARLRGAA